MKTTRIRNTLCCLLLLSGLVLSAHAYGASLKRLKAWPVQAPTDVERGYIKIYPSEKKAAVLSSTHSALNGEPSLFFHAYRDEEIRIEAGVAQKRLRYCNSRRLPCASVNQV